jgi:lysyl-tRNA synthetase class 2
MTRTAIVDLDRAAAPQVVLLRGRITFVSEDRLRLEDESGSVLVALGVCAQPPDGAWIEIEAYMDERTLLAKRIDVLSAPIGERWRVHGEWRWLHENERRRLHALKTRAAILRAIRTFFDARGFLEVETPSAVPSPGLDLHLDAFEVRGSSSERWLITSPEYQMKRLLSGGLERIYQICRCFRRGEQGRYHEPQFTMLEWYRAFAGSSDVMRDTEELVAHVAMTVLGQMKVRGPEGEIDLSPPWERLTVEEAFARYADVRMDEVLPDEERFFLLLTERIEPLLPRNRPVFLTEWPSSMASLARLLPERPARADRFEAFVSGVELCNGFGELTDSVEQRTRLERDRALRAHRGLPVYPLDHRFLAALEEGMPPSGGNALGVDRLVMVLLGESRLDDVIAVSESRLDPQ